MSAPVRDGLFISGDQPQLMGSRCRSCGRPHFPAHDTCPYCTSEDVRPDAFAGPGTLWAWTAVTAAPPGYEGTVPYGFGVVELPAGLRVIARLTEADPSQLHAGQSMDLVVVPLHDDVVTYAFRPS